MDGALRDGWKTNQPKRCADEKPINLITGEWMI
jgi:hypothetical protein